MLGLYRTSIPCAVEPYAPAPPALHQIDGAVDAGPVQWTRDKILLGPLGEYVGECAEFALGAHQGGGLVASPHPIGPIDTGAPSSTDLPLDESDEGGQFVWRSLDEEVCVVGEPGVGVETDVGPDLLCAPDDAGDDVVQDAAAVGAKEEASLKATQEDVIDDRWVVRWKRMTRNFTETNSFTAIRRLGGQVMPSGERPEEALRARLKWCSKGMQCRAHAG